ncbi:MAG: hypothetical protein WD039_06965 [Xanthobacteraceae bacterium]
MSGWQSAPHAMSLRFLDQGAAARARFSATWSDQITGATDLTFQAALIRMNIEAEAAHQAAFANSNSVVGKPRDSTILAGASTINLDEDTITLGDGTVLDIKTGQNIDLIV